MSIISNLKQCCLECSFPDIKVDNTAYGYYAPGDDHEVEHTDCLIYCSHENVCKYFNSTK